MESAWKLARQYFQVRDGAREAGGVEPGHRVPGQSGGFSHKYKAIARDVAYHGTTFGALSINGVKPGNMQGIYSITKAAVINMTLAFAKECAPWKIRANAILPGLTETKFASALTKNEQLLKMVLPQIPLGRVATPDEIAAPILFLCTRHAGFITGEVFNVNGGAVLVG